MVGQRRLSKGIQKMKITRKQLRKIILKEFRDIGNNDFENIDINVPPMPPTDDEGGGPGKDWSADLIKRLHKKGYTPMGRSSVAAKVLGAGESMVYVEDVKQNSGVVIHLHARDYRSDVLKITRKISGMAGAMIYDDLEKLRSRSPNDENEEFDFNTILNNDEYLIDYYAR